MVKYPVVFEPADDGGYGAFPPDLPGVGVVGRNRDEARELVRTAMILHLEGLRADGLPIPEPFSDKTVTELIEVA